MARALPGQTVVVKSGASPGVSVGRGRAKQTYHGRRRSETPVLFSCAPRDVEVT